MDRILIKDLLVRTIIGTKDDERRAKQDVLINVTLWADLRKAGRNDCIEDTLNYRTINKRILHLVEKNAFFLVEKLAESICGICLEDPRVERVQVQVEKPGALRFARSVGVEITREKG
jgi:dihydroneopterin aldolase/D-erythro-7,8-dihydroneopterin triphosphate epimerase